MNYRTMPDQAVREELKRLVEFDKIEGVVDEYTGAYALNVYDRATKNVKQRISLREEGR
jgi:hypothetical protein